MSIYVKMLRNQGSALSLNYQQSLTALIMSFYWQIMELGGTQMVLIKRI